MDIPQAKCPPGKHDYTYQHMMEVKPGTISPSTSGTGMVDSKRILYCRQCGDIKEIELFD